MSTNKNFKVGDRIRALTDSRLGLTREHPWYRAGEVGVVVEVDRQGDALVRWENQSTPVADSIWWLEGDAELVEAANAAG